MNMKQLCKQSLALLYFFCFLFLETPSWAEQLNIPPQLPNSVSAYHLVATAYGFIWAAVFAFVGSIAWRYRKLEQKIDALQTKIESHTKIETPTP